MPRASWKGRLQFSGFGCEVGLYAALSSTERISFHIVNRKTGNRVQRQFVDSDTGDTVERDDQVKGFELENGDHVVIEGDEIARLMPENDKHIVVRNFLACDEIDKLYFDRPYYLAATDADSRQALALFARALKERKAAALGEAVLFRRNRILLIRPQRDTLVATTLNYDYEVRSARAAFKGVPEIAMDAEMLDLAGHIIRKRSGTFDPAAYRDRYNDALAELVQARLEGRAIEKPAPQKESAVVDLREALRRSAGLADGRKDKPAKPAARRKAG